MELQRLFTQVTRAALDVAVNIAFEKGPIALSATAAFIQQTSMGLTGYVDEEYSNAKPIMLPEAIAQKLSSFRSVETEGYGSDTYVDPSFSESEDFGDMGLLNHPVMQELKKAVTEKPGRKVLMYAGLTP